MKFIISISKSSKRLFVMLAIFLITTLTIAQTKMSTVDWRADLVFLQQTVHTHYPFLFKKISSAQFDEKVKELSKLIPKMEEHEIVAGFARLVASFEYGHTSVNFRSKQIKYQQLPFNLYHFNDGIHIEGVHKDYKKVLGSRVLEIEGVPIANVLAAIRPIVAADNAQNFKSSSMSYLGIPEVLHAQGVTKELKRSISFTLQKDGQIFEQNIKAVKPQRIPKTYGFMTPSDQWLSARDQSQTPNYLKNLDKHYHFDYLSKYKTVYVRFSQVVDHTEENIAAFYGRVFDFVKKNDVERLVLDVRLNSGGNSYKNKPVVTGIIRAAEINQVGKLFVIIGRRTFSAAQNLVNELDKYTNVIFIGEPTGENINFYGDSRRVQLPNSKIPISMSFAWWQGKPEWENASWTAPDFAVDMSYEDYRSNKDPILEAALDLSNDNFILDPIDHLTKLFKAGKFSEVKTQAKTMVADSNYQFFDFEKELNVLGYNLLRVGQIKGALFVFELNTELFPSSANTWDSLAEAHLKANNKPEAIQYYQKAVELDPNGSTGQNAKTMLKNIN